MASRSSAYQAGSVRAGFRCVKLPRLRLAWLRLSTFWWRVWLGERMKLLADLTGTRT